MIFSIKIIWYLNSKMFERRNNRKHFFLSHQHRLPTIMDNDHLKQRRNKSYLWFHRASIRNKYAYFYFLRLKSSRNSWNGLHVNTTVSSACITMYNYLFGLEITSQMSWYLTETQLTHLSFRLRNLLLFLPSFQCFLVVQKVVEPL